MYVIQSTMSWRFLASHEHQEIDMVYTTEVNSIRVFTSISAAKRNLQPNGERIISVEQMLENNVDDSF